MLAHRPWPPLLAPSILAADFSCLGQQVAEAADAGADWLHVDVMDGHFVPNISIGLPVVAALRRVSRLPLDIHLMISEPERYIEAFRAAGADRISVHVEAGPHLQATIERIRTSGAQPGVALNPATPLVMVEPILPLIDLVLVMSVSPGFGGQHFLPASLDRIAGLRQMIDEAGLTTLLQVDGGVTAANIGAIALAGADVLVAGSAVFNDDEAVATAIGRLRAGLRRRVAG
jgi:ribulose-phosphate 3-epimerase